MSRCSVSSAVQTLQQESISFTRSSDILARVYMASSRATRHCGIKQKPGRYDKRIQDICLDRTGGGSSNKVKVFKGLCLILFLKSLVAPSAQPAKAPPLPLSPFASRPSFFLCTRRFVLSESGECCGSTPAPW